MRHGAAAFRASVARGAEIVAASGAEAGASAVAAAQAMPPPERGRERGDGGNAPGGDKDDEIFGAHAGGVDEREAGDANGGPGDAEGA